MQIKIACECGEEELLQSEETPHRNDNFHSKKFYFGVYDDGQSYIECNKCGKSLNF